MANEQPALERAVFLDRDGTLNEERGFLFLWQDWRWLPGVKRGLAALFQAGFRLVVVSNQSGIARGYYDESALTELNRKINEDLARLGISIQAFYHCPHHPDYTGPCGCRKPLPGMLRQAALELNLDLARSWLIGDKASDILAAFAVGVKPVLVETGYGHEQIRLIPDGVAVCENFWQAARYILKYSKNSL